jgi:hypothetical protein
VVKDARGVDLLKFWVVDGEQPSEREKRWCVGNDSFELSVWRSQCCDCHWESERSLYLAQRVVYLRNRMIEAFGNSEQETELDHIVFEYGVWDEGVFSEIQAGGPWRRSVEIPPEVAAQINPRARSV